MNNTLTSGGIATCTAQITRKKNRLKVYANSKPNQVFLNNGEEFEIELFNPKTSPVLAKISINGDLISTRGIVLYPGQRVFLERFIDTPKKFAFSTYEVSGDSKESKAAIALNGMIKVQFFDEDKSYLYNGGYTIIWNGGRTNLFNYSGHTLTIPTIGSGLAGTNIATGIPCTGTVLTTHVPSSFTCSSVSNTLGGTLTTSTSNFCDTSHIRDYQKNQDYLKNQQITTDSVLNEDQKTRSRSIETGRIEAGSKSKQDFSTTTGSFYSWASTIIELQIIPTSQKPVEISELASYCTECGTKSKKGWKFCPTCGSKW